MLFFQFVSSFCFLPVLVYSFGSEGTAPHVVELTPENFEERTQSSLASFHLFYTDGCGHCQKLKPVYEEFCQEVSKKSPKVLCSRLNCNNHKEFCESRGIRGYPQLERYYGKRSCEYVGERNLENLLSWYQVSVSVLEETKDIKSLQEHVGESGSPLVVGYFKKTGTDFENYLIDSTCDSTRVRISIIRDKTIASKFGIPDSIGIYVVKGGKLEKKYEGEPTSGDDVRRFLYQVAFGILPVYSIKNPETIFSPLFDLYLTLLIDSSSSNADKIEGVVEKIAEKQLWPIRFFVTDVSDSDSRNVVDYFKVKKFPSLCFYDHRGNKFYHYDLDDITSENVNDFINRCLNGKVEAYRAKQAIPDGWDKTPVKILVVDNFELAKSYKKNMFVMFFAPWCGHCKSMKGAWKALGEHYKDDETIMIAEMDATENDMPELKIQGFPTIKLFKPNGEILDYQGSRSFEALKDYVDNGFVIKKDVGESPDVPRDEL